MKNKTLAAWLSILGQPLGIQRFYLYGLTDPWGWLSPIPTALGLYGVHRARTLGVDDHLSWVLIPFLGLIIAIGALTAIIYGLMTPEKWNARFNISVAENNASGQTNWLTVMALACSLLIGAGVLMASLAFSFQRYFEYQIEEAQKISQPDD